MDKFEAYRIVDRYFHNDNPTEQDEFVFVEAAKFIIETEADAKIMRCLGGYYYGIQKYELAEKYYLMADENGDDYACCGLGFVYYYGRTGAKDFEKALRYFTKAYEKYNNLEAAMKIADMFHNGYGCEKDDAKYRALLEDIFEKVKDSNDLFDPYPEVAHRLADIYINENREDKARDILPRAKMIISQRIRYSPFWGNFIVARRVVELYRKVFELDWEEFDIDFFDLFYVFKKERTVKLVCEGKKYLIESFFDEGQMRVKFDDKFYKSTEDFLTNALINGKHLYIIEYDFDYYRFELVK